jgi:tryptophanyl-tRNA synthetase
MNFLETEPMKKGRILSGMRPTGPLHVGHLVGALENWAKLQNDYDCFYMVADWHALMSEYKEPKSIPRYSLENVADWIACGIDPEKSTIFVQSELHEHAELHMVLSCIVPIPWLERVPTYKEQLQELAAKEVNNYAFLGYPLLQAADIILYKADTVPVGEDQLPHLELTREVVRRFNGFYGNVFPEPQAKLTQVPRLLGTDRRKMSKSYGNFIGLSETDDSILKKTSTMFTDPTRIKRSDPGHPEECNVFMYHQTFGTKDVDTLARDCREARLGCTDCKAALGKLMTGFVRPIREKRTALLADEQKLRGIIKSGCEKARAVAKATLAEVRTAVFGI